jgi:hypothetical protein
VPGRFSRVSAGGDVNERPTDPRPLDFFELAGVLHRHAVEFVAIGGFAVIVHGYERATKDLDIVPEQSEQNGARLRAALEEVDARPRDVDDSVYGWALETRLGRLTVLDGVAGIDSYEALRANAIEVDLPGAGEILFAGFDDLLAMKRAAGRDQDLMDITALRMAHGLEE